MKMNLKCSELLYVNEKYIAEQKKKKELELKEIIESQLLEFNVVVLNIKNRDDYMEISYTYTMNEHTEKDSSYWNYDDSIETLIGQIKRHLNYIKELRDKYPLFVKQNDFIQSKRIYEKTINLKNGSYDRIQNFKIELCEYLKLPNTKIGSYGGGDYDIKQTPKRVKEYNTNIERTVMFLIDVISELNSMKCDESNKDVES